MTRRNRELADRLLQSSETALSDPSNADTLDLIIACALTEYEPGNVYLLALNGRRFGARVGSTLELMRWSRVAAEARMTIAGDARVGPPPGTTAR
jgi:hypothetical protein